MILYLSSLPVHFSLSSSCGYISRFLSLVPRACNKSASHSPFQSSLFSPVFLCTFLFEELFLVHSSHSIIVFLIVGIFISLCKDRSLFVEGFPPPAFCIPSTSLWRQYQQARMQDTAYHSSSCCSVIM